jgi:hypothetical protein
LYEIKWEDEMKWKGFKIKWPWPTSRYYANTCLNGLRKTGKSQLG